MVDVHPEDFCPTCGRLPYNQLFENQCGHTMYLGSDDKSDYYLYVDTGHEELTMCIRYGADGDYQSIPYRYSPKKFIKKLTYITKGCK